MEFWKNLTNAVVSTKDMIVEKNKKSALMNRLRAVIKCEEQSCARAYMALGRYYYHHLRDKEDAVAEPHCQAIDAAEARLDSAIAHLEKLHREDRSDCWTEEITLEGVVELDEEDVNRYFSEDHPAEDKDTQPLAPEKEISQATDTQEADQSSPI